VRWDEETSKPCGNKWKHMRQREMRDIGAHVLFTLHAQKIYLTIHSLRRPPVPATGCHAIGTCETHALRGVGGLRGAQAVRDL
jgi:hypothetical protein